MIPWNTAPIDARWVPAVDGLPREQRDREREQRQHERELARHERRDHDEHERRAGDGSSACPRRGCWNHTATDQSISTPNVSDVADVPMKRVVRDRRTECDNPRDSERRRYARPRQASLDPEARAREEERSDVEEVALLDPKHARLGREGRDLDTDPDDHRDRRGDDDLLGARQCRPANAEQHEREHRHEADVQRELGEMPEEPVRDGADVIALPGWSTSRRREAS